MRELSTERLINYLILQYDSQQLKAHGLEKSYQNTLLHARNLVTEYIQTQIGGDLDFEGAEARLTTANNQPLGKEAREAVISLSLALQKNIVSNDKVSNFITEKLVRSAKLNFLCSHLAVPAFLAGFCVTPFCLVISATKTFLNPSYLSNLSISNPFIVLCTGVAFTALSWISFELLTQEINHNSKELKVGLNKRIHNVLCTSFAESELAKKLDDKVLVI